jgi:hypothetical protein
MAITVVNGTPAQGLEFSINGYIDGSANPPLWSGSLSPMNTSGYSINMDVSGYDSYSVSFYIVGYAGENLPNALSQPVADGTTVMLTINVLA